MIAATDMLHWLSLQVPALDEAALCMPALSMAVGVRPASGLLPDETAGAVHYPACDAFVPRAGWQPLALAATAPGAAAPVRPRLGVFRWPGFDPAAWARHALHLRFVLRGGSAACQAVDEASAALEALFDARGPAVRHGVNWNVGGLHTVTVDLERGHRPGLHIDTWDRGDRADALTRICLNLGPGDRYFVFVPLHWSRPGALAGGEPTPDQLTRWFSGVADLPVCRLRLRPGEGYFADTDNLIHDGSTHGLGLPNANLTLRGRFGVLDGMPRALLHAQPPSAALAAAPRADPARQRARVPDPMAQRPALGAVSR